MDFSHTVSFPITESMDDDRQKYFKENCSDDELTCVFGQVEKLRTLHRNRTQQMVYIFTDHPGLPRPSKAKGNTNYAIDWGDMYFEEFNTIAGHIPVTIVTPDTSPKHTYNAQCHKNNLPVQDITFVSVANWWQNFLRKLVLHKKDVDQIDYGCDKLFVIMNGKPTGPRIAMMLKLASKGLLEHSHWSWHGEKDSKLPIRTPGFAVDQTRTLGVMLDRDESYLLPAEYHDSYIDVQVESLMHPDAVYITEKTVRPYLCLKPSLCLNSYGHYNYLESIGVKLYDELFNYDIIEQPTIDKRISGIVQNLKTLLELSKYDLEDKIRSIESKMRYNKELFSNLVNETMPTKEIQHLLDRNIFPTDCVFIEQRPIKSHLTNL